MRVRDEGLPERCLENTHDEPPSCYRGHGKKSGVCQLSRRRALRLQPRKHFQPADLVIVRGSRRPAETRVDLVFGATRFLTYLN